MQLRKPSYKTNGGEVRQSARWHVRFRDHLNTRRRVPAFTDKRMSEKLGEKLDGLAARVRAGEPLGDIEKWVDTLPGDLRDRLIGWGLLSRETRLDELVDAYHEAQLDKDTSERTAGETRRRILRVFTGCGFAFFRDIDAEIVTAWLREQRDSGTAKATSNAWLAAARSFCNWMVKRGAVVKSPLLAADPVPNNDGRAFGCFTQDQVRQLLAHCVAASSVWGLKQREPVVRDAKKGSRTPDLTGALDGPARATLYQLAVETALRAGSIRSLRVAQVTIERNPNGTARGGTIRTTSGQQKNRVAHEVHIRAPLATLLAEQIAGKTPAARALAVPHHLAAMLRQDLFDAGLPLIDEDGLPLKFHSFRVSAATWVGDATGSDKSVQSLTGHLTRSTAAHYNRMTKRTQLEAVESLPDDLRATGTAGPLVQSLPKPVQNSASECRPIGPYATINAAGVAELADAPDSKSGARKGVWVRVPPPA